MPRSLAEGREIKGRPGLVHLDGDGKPTLAILRTRAVMSKSAARAVSASMQLLYLWHFGQWKLDLPDCTVRTIRPPQPGFVQGSPARP